MGLGLDYAKSLEIQYGSWKVSRMIGRLLSLSAQ